MQLVIFIGLQASGKSTYYARRFVDSHIRLNLDMLRTRHREQILLDACMLAKQPVVIDNTNPTVEERARYIATGRENKFQVVGYYFQSKIEDCTRRNAQRSADQLVRAEGLLSTYGRLILPTTVEGFDQLYYVRIDETGQFVTEAWADEIR